MSHRYIRDAYELTDQQAEIIQRGSVEARESAQEIANGRHCMAKPIEVLTEPLR